MATVKPILEYAAPAWLPSFDLESREYQLLDRLDHKAKRIITGALMSTPKLALDVETSIPPLFIRVTKLALRFINNSYHNHLKLILQLSNHHNQHSVLNNLLALADHFNLINPSLFPNVCVNPQYKRVPLSSKAKKIIDTVTVTAWQELWDNSTTGRKYHLVAPTVNPKSNSLIRYKLPRPFECALHRLRFNHFVSNQYNHKLDNTTSSICNLCDTNTDTRLHLLTNCPFSSHLDLELYPQLKQLCQQYNIKLKQLLHNSTIESLSPEHPIFILLFKIIKTLRSLHSPLI